MHVRAFSLSSSMRTEAFRHQYLSMSHAAFKWAFPSGHALSQTTRSYTGHNDVALAYCTLPEVWYDRHMLLSSLHLSPMRSYKSTMSNFHLSDQSYSHIIIYE